MTTGILILAGKKKTLQVKFTNANGKEVTSNIKESELSAAIAQKKGTNIDSLNNLEVDFEEVKGQPTKIREKGQSWEVSTARPTVRQPSFNPPQNQRNRQSNPQSLATARQLEPEVTHSRDFHNPYNFIPALPRENLDFGLKDGEPVGHDRYHDNHWSGRIAVTLTTVTPLLIPDAAKATEVEGTADHYSYPLRRVDGKPYLPPTSIKGMLRSAYEAVTNSRMGVFHKHEARLAYRMPAGDGLSLVPARIEGNCDRIQLLLGTTENVPERNQRWDIPDNLMYAAWLPRYRRDSKEISPYAISPNLEHGVRVKVWLQKYRRNPFKYWRVLRIVRFDQNIGQEPLLDRTYGNHEATKEIIQAEGYLCISGKNIDKKHDERVFFLDPDHSRREHLTISFTPEEAEDLQKAWNELIKDYQEVHKQEIENGVTGPPALNHSEWSRHVIGGETETQLSDGTLCYAYVEEDGEGFRVVALYPVAISRKLFAQSPLDLLPESLRPATQLEDLSPADRVFGWVKQQSKKAAQPELDESERTTNKSEIRAYRGQLRISTVECVPDYADAVKEFEEPLPLAILGQPQPQQFRFYVAKNRDGDPLPDKTLKDNGYEPGYGLRGRKVYPHHQTLDERESRRQPHNGQDKDNQNRSIQAWVKPEVEFKFDIDVINLSGVELGALLWLLNFPESSYHRLGGGKPLGFGSVKLTVDWQSTDLRLGEEWRKFYSSLLSPPAKPDATQARDSIEEFKKAIASSYNSYFLKVPFIAAFLQAAKGFEDGKPIHYPRTTVEPNPAGEGFDWFEKNEKDGREEKGLKLSLPLLTQDSGLPLNPTTS